MPGLFDVLNKRLEEDEPGGITPLDLTDLPTEQKTIMLALLRDQAGTVQGVTNEALRNRVGVKVADFDTVLQELEKQGWLIISGEAPKLHYRINFRAKRSSQGGALTLWAVLSDRISKEA